MIVSSPLWLLGLLPWAMVVVWLLIGRGQLQAVPYIQFWHAPESLPRTSRAHLRVPPIGIALSILATLLAILAAAHPLISLVSDRVSQKITIIADHRMTIAKWNDLVDLADRSLREQFGDGPVVLIDSYGKSVETDLQSWAALARQTEVSVSDRQEPMKSLVADLLKVGGPVIFLSDQNLSTENLSLIQFAPEQSPKNVGIAGALARATPQPQVMVSVRNDSELSAAQLRVAEISQPIELPPRGQSRNYFIDLKELPSAVPIELIVSDDLPLDNHVRLAREHAWPRIEVTDDIPAPLVRMIETYSRLRAPSENPARLVVAVEPVADQAAVIVATLGSKPVQGEARSIDHPINANLDWSKIIKQSIRSGAVTPSGWQTIAWGDQTPLVAVRENPDRQVWVGFDSDAFSKNTDFVVFWTNVFDWAGQGGDRYAFQGAAAVAVPESFKTDWETKLKALPISFRAASDFSAPFSLAGIILIWAASIVWKRVSRVG